MILNQLIAQMVTWGRQWVSQQRTIFRPLGHLLSDSALATFSNFFDRNLLKNVRVVTVPGIDNPPFLEQLRPALSQASVPVLDFSSMAAITFVDTILLVESAARDHRDSLVFHELIHVVQYDILGPDKFVELFITGWVNQGFNYAAIPLEMDAYELQYNYESAPGVGFDVQDEVSQRLELMMED
jgi:hypothetical protein